MRRDIGEVSWLVLEEQEASDARGGDPGACDSTTMGDGRETFFREPVPEFSVFSEALRMMFDSKAIWPDGRRESLIAESSHSVSFECKGKVSESDWSAGTNGMRKESVVVVVGMHKCSSQLKRDDSHIRVVTLTQATWSSHSVVFFTGGENEGSDEPQAAKL